MLDIRNYFKMDHRPNYKPKTMKLLEQKLRETSL